MESKNGVENFTASWVYDINANIKETVTICTAESAAESVYNKFKEKIADYPTVINNLKLVYLPMPIEYGKEYELHPYWEFYATENLRSVQEYWDFCSTLFVDAQTSDVLENVVYY